MPSSQPAMTFFVPTGNASGLSNYLYLQNKFKSYHVICKFTCVDHMKNQIFSRFQNRQAILCNVPVQHRLERE